jgi:hypothetical protein
MILSILASGGVFMGFLEKARTTVGQSVSRVVSEADKTIKLTRVSNELGGKRHDLDKAFAELGRIAYGLIGTGGLPEDR